LCGAAGHSPGARTGHPGSAERDTQRGTHQPSGDGGRDPKYDADGFQHANQDGHPVRAAVQNRNPDVDLHTDRHGHQRAYVHVHASPAHAYLQRHARSTDRHRHGRADLTGRLTVTMDTALRERLTGHLTELSVAAGPPGFEAPTREILHKWWAPLTDETRVSPLGNLYALSRGRGDGERPTMAVVAHMDSIGFIVKDVVDGFVRLSGLGIPDVRVLAGQRLLIRGRKPVPGMIVLPPEASTKDRERGKAYDLTEIWVDAGMAADDLGRLVRTGDLAVFDQPVLPLGESLRTGPGLDNHSSLVALTEALERITAQPHAWDIWAVASTSEERNLAGAATAGFHLAPDIAIILDVTFGRGPGDPMAETFPLGSGLTNGLGPQLHPAVHAWIGETAEHAGIPIADEILPEQTGTDADVIQSSIQGVACGLISLPVRNMHTAVEVVHVNDIAQMAALLEALMMGSSSELVLRIDRTYSDD
jgi:putative aminopeptidase FrvX